MAHKKQTPRQDLPDGGLAVPSGMSLKEGESGSHGSLKNPMPTEQNGKPIAKGSRKKPLTVAEKISVMRDVAQDMALDREIPEADWPIYLRHKAQEMELGANPGDISRWLYEAKAHRDGRIELLRSHTKLNTRPIPWLWQGVIQKQAVNLIHALPKCGKTRLVIGLLSAWIHGAETYLGREINQGQEGLLIVGPDQPEPVWAEVLKDYQLLDENGHMHERIVGLVPSGGNFALTEKGIALIEEEARANPGLVILLDSYQRAIGPMGIDENRPEAAVPLTQLMEAIAPHKATLIVIHHSNKSGAEGSVSAGARGSSALTAVPDQLIRLKPFQKQEDDGGPKEIELETVGRAGKPVRELIQLEDDGRTWVSLGSPSKRRKQIENEKKAQGMTDLQREVMTALVIAWQEDKTALTGKEVLEAVGRDPERERTKIHGWIKALEAKGWVLHAGDKPSTGGKPQKFFKPTQAGIQAIGFAET